VKARDLGRGLFLCNLDKPDREFSSVSVCRMRDRLEDVPPSHHLEFLYPVNTVERGRDALYAKVDTNSARLLCSSNVTS